MCLGFTSLDCLWVVYGDSGGFWFWWICLFDLLLCFKRVVVSWLGFALLVWLVCSLIVAFDLCYGAG